MWVSITSNAACAAALQQAVEDYGVVDTATLQAVLHHDASGFARALCTALQAEPPAAQHRTATDAAVPMVPMVNASSQTTADDVVDTATAEAMVEEALSMVSEAEEREHAEVESARRWYDVAQMGAALLRKAEARSDCAQSERQAAEMLAAAEHASRQMAEEMLAVEAALADAAVESALDERAARLQAEAQRDIYQALAGAGRGTGRGGRVAEGSA